MRAVVITEHGQLEVLKVQERPDPPVGPGEVRIAVKAAGINFADTLARTGMYPDSPKVPCVVGYEVAGVAAQLLGGHPRPGVDHRQLPHPAAGGVKPLPVQIPHHPAVAISAERRDRVQPVDRQLTQALKVRALAAEPLQQEHLTHGTCRGAVKEIGRGGCRGRVLGA
jgi:hypothetical protein